MSSVCSNNRHTNKKNTNLFSQLTRKLSPIKTYNKFNTHRYKCRCFFIKIKNQSSVNNRAQRASSDQNNQYCPAISKARKIQKGAISFIFPI